MLIMNTANKLKLFAIAALVACAAQATPVVMCNVIKAPWYGTNTTKITIKSDDEFVVTRWQYRSLDEVTVSHGKVWTYTTQAQMDGDSGTLIYLVDGKYQIRPWSCR